MPTLTMIDPNILNLDYFYSNYTNSYKIAFDEENPSNTQPISANFKPMDCITKALHRNTKTTHFIKAPSTTAITFYLCDKYHTNFIIFSKTILNPTKPTNFTTFTASTTNKKTKIILDNLNKITQFIPPFPTSFFSHRKNYDNSVKLMEDLPWRYNEQGWTLIENTLLVNYAACQRELNQIRKYP